MTTVRIFIFVTTNFNLYVIRVEMFTETIEKRVQEKLKRKLILNAH